jgi:hypothetical protein
MIFFFQKWSIIVQLLIYLLFNFAYMTLFFFFQKQW